ncbi:MAG: response regulator, partial [Planctomycetota bacterium]
MATQVVHLLVVDDGPLCYQLIREVLSQVGRAVHFEITQSVGLDSALKYLESGANDIDAVLLDPGSPDGPGTETLCVLHDAYPDLPIVVLTGLEDEDADIDAIRKGAQDNLHKSELSGGLLKRAIRHAMERMRSKRQLQESKRRYQRIAEMLTDYTYTVRWDHGAAAEMVHSPACLAVTGYSPAEFASNPNLWTEIVH